MEAIASKDNVTIINIRQMNYLPDIDFDIGSPILPDKKACFDNVISSIGLPHPDYM